MTLCDLAMSIMIRYGMCAQNAQCASNGDLMDFGVDGCKRLMKWSQNGIMMLLWMIVLKRLGRGLVYRPRS